MNFWKWLRLELLLKDLEFCFKLSVSNIFLIPGYLLCLSACNLLWVFYHEPEVLKPSVPKCFTSFSDTGTRVVLDWTVIFIQNPSSLKRSPWLFLITNHTTHSKHWLKLVYKGLYYLIHNFDQDQLLMLKLLEIVHVVWYIYIFLMQSMLTKV